MSKSADAFRTISEVADWLGVPAHVLRFWESKFSQVKPVKRAGGRRYYRPSDMQLLGGIRKLLHDDGMTIKGVQKILRENGIKHVAAFSGPLDIELGTDTVEHVDTPPDAPMTTDAEPDAAETAKVLSFSRDAGDAPAEPTPEAAPESSAQEDAGTPDPVATPVEDPAPAPAPTDDTPSPSPAEPETADAATPEAPQDTPSSPATPALADAAPDPKPDPAPDPEPAPAAPRPTPVTVPDDPPDSVDAEPGSLAALAQVDPGTVDAKRAALRSIADRLRALGTASPSQTK